jgi:hypothetical protein
MGSLPPLGDQQGWDARTCQRELGAHLCGRHAAWHVIWDQTTENSVACDTHATEAMHPWHAEQVHQLTADCTMPGSVWLPEERRCVFPADGVPTLAAELSLAGG